MLAPTAGAALDAQEEGLTLAQSKVVSYTVTVSKPRLTHVRRINGTLASCFQKTRKITAEGVGFIDLFWIKQQVAYCSRNLEHGGAVIADGPWFTQPCRGRDWGIPTTGIGWNWKGWVDCRTGGGVGKGHLMRGTSGWFQLVHRGVVVQNGKPWVNVTGYALCGCFSSSAGGF